MAVPCVINRPRVINYSMIKKCINDQLPKGVAGELAKLNETIVEDTEQIRLEYLNILRIDSLWILKSLKVLSLNNNLIEKIENLDTLVHLEELDLSFNKISRIENLDKLVNLVKLGLYMNLIKVVENLEKLVNLRIISLGMNEIAQKESIIYFRQFRNLTSLNMVGNPCTKESNFQYYVAALLPNISYYQYKKLTLEDVTIGTAMFSETLKRLQQKEGVRHSLELTRKTKEAENDLLEKCFVKYLNSGILFDEMFENDNDGIIFLEIEDCIDNFNLYKENFLNICEQLIEIGKKNYEERERETEKYNSTVKNNKAECHRRAKNLYDKFHDLEQQNIDRAQKYFNDHNRLSLETGLYIHKFSKDCDVYLLENDSLINVTRKQLMKNEVELLESIEELNTGFEQIIEEMVNKFIQEAQLLFTSMRDLAQTYKEEVNDLTKKYICTMHTVHSLSVSQKLFNLLLDKDALQGALTQSFDTHLLTIDNREDFVMQSARSWYTNFIKEIKINFEE
ncbi:dynein regulatory complex subunit 3 isoform X2 [Aethina tumida]|uniref:dynein regulatory complex subunit 3 isoform X2 n=1 Tax=Aethina tumida TaxID=116153 RepID=UPI00096B5671|nr:dynein regulatory complex subunit 3 isoform X2 [Aethina tumida]